MDEKSLEQRLASRGWSYDPERGWTAPRKGVVPDRLAQSAERKPDPGPKPLGAPKRARPDPVRRTVLITSYRRELLDERNLFDKYLTDSLIYAGILFDDSPAWAEIKVRQVKVTEAWEEKTTIHIFPL